jgi:hypothetical protein
MKTNLILAWISVVALAMWPLALAAAPRCQPTSRFVVLSGGLVRDTLTKLVWQQQASTTGMSWANAKTYCANAGSGFRLPTVKELESLVDLVSYSSGIIDKTAFPNAPAEYRFWTSLEHPGASGYAWAVWFNNGMLNGYEVGGLLSVRCVR